ncbi:MAG: tRNA(Met) cytidine acetyltransferase [Candidatus Helarchaeota archaeon]|nr:tRNA(Met) cytidine acetyltransferase [Candidatus Helarchaeota archaeon]
MEDNVFFENCLQKFEEEVKKAIKNNHRRMFVLPEGNIYDIIPNFFTLYIILRPAISTKVLFASSLNNSTFQDISSNLDPTVFHVTNIKFSQLNKILGQTFDILVLDLTKQLKPNDLGILIETVRGGGIIFVLTPNFKSWKKKITFFQQTLITPPFTIDDINFRFTPFFIDSLKKYKGIIIFDSLNHQIQEGSYNRQKTPLPMKEIHTTSPFKKMFYDLVATADQRSFLNSLEFILQRDRKKRGLILTADRGRGKSAILGIGAIALSHFLVEKLNFSYVKILITAPKIENAEIFLQFAEKALKSLNYKIRTRKKSLITDKITIQYKTLLESINQKSNLTIIDECGSIPIPILLEILESSQNIIFSSTLHGYEGAGRGFSILFRKELFKKKDLKISQVGLNEPIRYSFNDPIEQWLFDTLFLNAQPAKLSSDDVSDVTNSNLNVEKIDLDECFLGKKQEIFSDFAGIFVFAHYRNQPDDIVLLSDSPHYEAWAIFTKNKNHIVNVVQIAKEGNLSDTIIQEMLMGKQTPGNLIPWICITHYRLGDFAKLRGARIVRIATHPDLFQKGLGTKMLTQIEENYKNLEFDWIGTSFGLTPELLRFWEKNGYKSIHLSSRMTPSTGEYSIVMIKPLSAESEKIVNLLRQEFKFKIFEWFRTIYYNLPPDLAFSLLESSQKFEDPVIFKIALTENQKDRLDAYFGGILDYSNTSDVINQVLKYYFLNFERDKVKLSPKQKELIIMRCLQARTWQQTLNYSKLKYKVGHGLLRKAIRKIYKVI